MPSNVYRISALEAKICLRTIGEPPAAETDETG